MTDRFLNQLLEETRAFGISLEKEQAEQFYRYYELLVEWNQVMNLTAITEEQDVVTKHFTDSLSLIKVFRGLGQGSLSAGGEESGESFSLIDVGTGAGFPGIPLKIAFPELKVTLLDSLNKRVKFLTEVCGQLGLENINAVHGRKILEEIRNTAKSMICAYPGRWQIWPPCRSTVCRLYGWGDILCPTSQGKLRRS